VEYDVLYRGRYVLDMHRERARRPKTESEIVSFYFRFWTVQNKGKTKQNCAAFGVFFGAKHTMV